MSTEWKNLDSVIDSVLDDQRIVGTVVLVSRQGELVYQRAAGLADREAGIPMREDAIFRLASLSKPMVSAAALAAVEQGILGLDDLVTKWIPEFRPSLADGTPAQIAIRQLLSHTAGFAYGFLEADDGPYHRANVSDGLDQPGISMDENLRRIASVPLAYRPGTSWGYSVSTDIAGEAIARASARPLEEVVSRFVTSPLSMKDTGFAVDDRSRLVTPYADGSPRPVRMGELALVKMVYGPGSIRFAPDRIFHRDSYPSGGCGMAGTAGDFLKFLEALRTGGGPILSDRSLSAMTSDQSAGRGPRPGTAYGFGLSVITDPEAAQTPQSSGTVAWGGVYGHQWFVDRAKGLSVVSLTNTAIKGMAGRFPMEVRSAIYEAIGSVKTHSREA